LRKSPFFTLSQPLPSREPCIKSVHIIVILTPMQIGGRIRSYFAGHGFFVVSLLRMTFDTTPIKGEDYMEKRHFFRGETGKGVV